MGDVVGINGHPPSVLGEPNLSLIALLKDLLAKAESGQIQQFAATGFCSDGSRISAFSNVEEDVYSMLGALAWLQHEYVDRITGKAE